MLFTLCTIAAMVSTVAAQSLSAAPISGLPSTAPVAVPSSRPYENPFTMYLTMTNSYGVVTGMPSVVTSQPSVITAQPTVATIAAGLESSMALGTGALVPSTGIQSEVTGIPSGMTTVVSATNPSDLTQSTMTAPPTLSISGSNSRTGSAPPQQSTGVAAQVKASGALLGAAALAIIAL